VTILLNKKKKANFTKPTQLPLAKQKHLIMEHTIASFATTANEVD